MEKLPVFISSWLFNKNGFRTCNISSTWSYSTCLSVSRLPTWPPQCLWLPVCLPCPADGAFSCGPSRYFCPKIPVRRVCDYENQGCVWQIEFCAEVSSSECSDLGCLTIVNRAGKSSLWRPRAVRKYQSFSGCQWSLDSPEPRTRHGLHTAHQSTLADLPSQSEAQLKCPQTLLMY